MRIKILVITLNRLWIFLKCLSPLVDKIVDFYASIMNEIDNRKRDDLNYDLEGYLYFKDESKSALRNFFKRT